MKLSKAERDYLTSEFQKWINSENPQPMLEYKKGYKNTIEVPLIKIYNADLWDLHLHSNDYQMMAQELLKKAVFYSHGNNNFLLEMLREAPFYIKYLTHSFDHGRVGAYAYMQQWIEWRNKEETGYCVIPPEIVEEEKADKETETLNLEVAERKKEFDETKEGKRQMIILRMLKNRLLALDLDLGMHPDILGNLGHCAGRYIGAGTLSGHLSIDNTMRHFVNLLGVHQNKSNMPMFKSTLMANIELGMTMPATTPMVEDLIYSYRQERERNKLNN